MRFNKERSSAAKLPSLSSSQTSLSTGAAPVAKKRVSRVSAVRIVFLLFLAGVAAVLGVGAYFVLKDSEENIAEEQFDSIADRALDLSKGIAHRQKHGLLTLASMAEQTFPDAEMWPFVNFQGFEVVAKNLIETSSGQDMGLLPVVTPGDKTAFEEFATSLYPDAPFKTITGLDRNRTRYNETDGTTYWGSPYKLFTPFLYHSLGPIIFIANYHSIEIRGREIDKLIQCSEERARDILEASNSGEDYIPQECSFLTDILDLSTSIEVKNPAAAAYQPIFPANDPSVLVGFISSAIRWVDVLVDVFNSEVSGVDCVLATDTQVFTYIITDGMPTLKGKGDLHDSAYSDYSRTIQLVQPDSYSRNTPNYTLTLYPREELFEVYATRNPGIATAGVVCVILFTSALFLLYDLCVRQQFNQQEALSKAKKQFVRFISHEVRTPLNSVCIGLQLLEDEAQNLISSQTAGSSQHLSTHTKEQLELSGKLGDFKDLSEDIHRNATSAVGVLSDLLNYDKVESGSLELELTVLDIWDLIERTYSEFHQQANVKGIDYKLDYSSLVDDPEKDDTKAAHLPQEIQNLKAVGDKARLGQVVRNLISNALKFTPKDGKLYIRASWARYHDSKPPSELTLHSGETENFLLSGVLRVEFTDTGAGMSREQLKNLFNEGVQFNVNQLQAGQGSGLGLYIAKGILTQHGGSLTADSQGLGRGTTFFMDLPLYYISSPQKPEQAPENCRPDPGVLKSLTILIVDDAATNRKLLRRLLQNKGHICDEAENGLVALQCFKDATESDKRYDSVLMDFQMPEMDGPTATKELRAMGCDSFIAGITGNCFSEQVTDFKDAGANIVLPKPLEINVLMDAWLEYGLSEVE